MLPRNFMHQERLCLALQTMSDSLMYRLTYYRFADASTMAVGQRGYDRVRNCQIGLMDFKCAH